MTRLSVIVPIFNGENEILDLYLRMTEAFQDKIDNYEIIFINNGSKDQSARVLEEISLNDLQVKVVHLARNYGKTAAIKVGIHKSTSELISLMDTDNQIEPRDLLKFMPFMAKVDFVNGRRIYYKSSLRSLLTLQLGNRIRNWITGDRLRDTDCPMKLFKREVADHFFYFNGMHRFLPTMAMMSGFSIIEVSVTCASSSQRRGIHNLCTGIRDAMLMRCIKKRAPKYKVIGDNC
ncbi:glycosyltransferase [Paenibacillus sp. CAA11]|uniref:glycosyltransferase n=1 Tax=Paenibacillus sp. CAA11 TaxID=1532905 RepID=UPI00131ED46A|nr:glycosyltransferase [Paenibacillus sp. CAA11]